MAVGFSDGTSFADRWDWMATSLGSNDSTMPLESPRKPAGEFKSSPGGEIPENGENIKPRSVLDKLTGLDGGERFQTWPERMARSAFTLPGDVLSGKVEPGSIQEIERAADLAGLVVAGPAPVAAKLADGTLGSFAGVKSKTLPKDKLYEAQNMELDMLHPDDIWEKTGFFRGADTRWRYEIPDRDAKLKPEAFQINKEIIDNPNGWANTGNHGDVVETWAPKTLPRKAEVLGDLLFPAVKQPLTLDKVIDHPELFKAYPELKTMKVEPLPEYLKSTGVKGQVAGDTLYLAEGHPDYLRSVLLHEIQHGIQHHEGFAYGGNQTQFLPRELPQAEKEFLEIRKQEEPNIAKELEEKPLIFAFPNKVERAKSYIREEQEGSLTPGNKLVVERLKKEKPEVYRKLSNIVKSERLIQQAHEGAFRKYQQLMGEVEARNVQARSMYNSLDRQAIPPYRSEDVARPQQINIP